MFDTDRLFNVELSLCLILTGYLMWGGKSVFDSDRLFNVEVSLGLILTGYLMWR